MVRLALQAKPMAVINNAAYWRFTAFDVGIDSW